MPGLQFGIFDTFAPDEIGQMAVAYDAHIRDAQTAEAIGYDYYFFIEHQNARFPCISSPSVYLASVARATERLRIGAMVYQIPMHHPVRLAQDAAMVDQLSKGRLEFAIGYGTQAHEFDRWKINYRERRAMGLEAMDIVLKAWTSREFTFEGKYWSVDKALPQPHPYQKPYPPVWMGGHSQASFDYAAENDFDVAQNLDVESVIAEKFAYFKRAWREKRHARPAPRTLLVRHVHVAETDEQARAEAESFMREGLGGQSGVARALALRDEEKTPEMIEIARLYVESAKSYDFWIDEGLAFVGSPSTVVRRIADQQKLAGYDILLAHHQITSMPHDLAAQSMRLFGERVIPAFADTPIAV